MITNRQGHDRVLRIRKMPLKPNVIIWSNSYTVWNEHNYFCDLRKKRYRDLDKTCSSIEFVEKITNNMCDSLPDWLNEYTSSSDDDDSEEVFKIPSLAQLLKKELERDFAREKNDKYKKKQKLNKIKPAGFLLVNKYDLSNEQSGLEPKLMNCYSHSNVSKNSEVLNNKCAKDINNVEKSSKIVKNVTLTENVRVVKSYKKKTISQKSPSQTICSARLSSVCSQVKRKTEETFSSIDLLPTSSSMYKKSRKDSSDNLQSGLSSLLTENNSETSSYNACSINGIGSFQKDTFVNIIDLCPVYPPFDWIHLIYLCIKNSSNEYVTCVDVQKFCRYWFPYYLKTSWIRDIQSTLIQYNENYFYRFPISANSCDLWTVSNESVIALETILMSVVEKDESQIKSSMNQPDKLSLLLKGYGVLNLGYGCNFKNY